VEFSTKAGTPDKQKAGCVVVGVFEPRRLSDAAAALDRASGGRLKAILRQGDFEGKFASTLLLPGIEGVAAQRVLLLGLGKHADFGTRQLRDAVRAATRALGESGAEDALFYIADLTVQGRDAAWTAMQFAVAAGDASYRFDALKSKSNNHRRRLRLGLGVQGKASRSLESGLEQGRALADGMSLAKDLGNLPSNICTPSYLARTAIELGKQYKLRCQVLNRPEMEKLHMGALLAVTKGTREPPKFIVLHYNGGAKKAKPVALVGKGHYVRHRRDFDQAQRRDGRDEVRHVRCRQCAGHDQSGGADAPSAECGRRDSELREHALAETPSSPAISSRACRARPSRSSTPMPRDA
jgi:leucyl aminopeptidase